MLRERHYAPEAIQSRLQEMEELWEELLASCQDKRAKLQDAYKVMQGYQWLVLVVISRGSMAALLNISSTSVSLDTIRPDSSRSFEQETSKCGLIEWYQREN